MKRIDVEDFSEIIRASRCPAHDNYLAMYSTVYGGIVTDPTLMLIPIDDHMVHRGDGVFEALKCVDGNVYNMKAHLARLRHSAGALALALPMPMEGIGSVIVETVRASGEPFCGIRLFVSRGPGSFDVNPYDPPASQLYVIVTKWKKPFMETHPEGARVGISLVPVKLPVFARVKSCNYLPNVLMKMEAVDAGLDVVVGFDTNGILSEGPTENMGIVTSEKVLLVPKLDGVLRGTTMMRVMDLAKSLVERGELGGIRFADISKTMIHEASEVLIFGTTRDVTFVREFDGRPVGEGVSGPVFRSLGLRLQKDMHDNAELLTPVFGPRTEQSDYES